MAVEVKSDGAQMAESVDASPKAEEVAEKQKQQEQEQEQEQQEEEYSAVPAVAKSASFKEESNFLSDLKESERKALTELRAKVEEAIAENKLFRKETEQEKPEEKAEEEKAKAEAEEAEKPDSVEKEEENSETIHEAAAAKKPESEEAEAEPERKEEKPAEAVSEEKAVEVSLWGVPLLPSKGSERTDVILLKFLRARDFKVKDAFEMLEKTLQWRKDSNIDSILDEEGLGSDLDAACYMDGVDREGHPVCYNVPGVFEDGELYQKAFGTEEGRGNFVRWRVRVMEKGIEELDLRPGGVTSILQIMDLKNSPGPSKKELRATMKQVVQLLQDNYPEFVARTIFINVPFWYYAFSAILSPFLTQRTKSKFVFARPAKVTETLLKYIPAEAIPIKYGGLKRENDAEFSVEDGGVTELIIKANSTENIEIPAPEAGTTVIWDLIVLGWEVNYKEEFVPTDEGSYTIIVKKEKKMGPQEEAVRNSFKNYEPGKVVLTIENNTFKKKKVLYRYKAKNSPKEC
ncbi:patellin-4 isoform X2 [Ananas comosus]|uniref:Patellin-4 n=1 Tax=Ananas comosus TaxID=4615 RepID=A0A199V3N4_ANACO|nr:patellin-4 isoform X2 [Ananas comosus]OAY71516.1 Patellin-4 [Ananas comosus]